ncbi:MAG: OsmC family protein [Thermoleophilia bacterium]|nr:OsmC family protein [Thermoleophilia bacterium]
MDMEVYFPGNKRVHARYKGFVIETDQAVDVGGDESAPAPFDLFIASLGTCVGIYVLRFLEERGLSTEGAGISLSLEEDLEAKLVRKISLQIKLPPDFPPKYIKAITRTAKMCAVKRHLENPPEFETTATIAS